MSSLRIISIGFIGMLCTTDTLLSYREDGSGSSFRFSCARDQIKLDIVSYNRLVGTYFRPPHEKR